MATIPWLVDVLRGAGVQVVVEGDWLNRMRPGSFDPIGVLWHHTAATSSASNPHPALNICINGRSDLAGPLCQALVDYNGVFHVISAGRCNHAGASGGSGPIPAGDGNTLMIGWEIDYNGVNQEMTAAQYNASIAATAAVLTRLGRDTSYARGHRETSTSGKIDPSFIDLNVMRADVAAKMSAAETPRRGPPSWTTPPPAGSPPAPTGVCRRTPGSGTAPTTATRTRRGQRRRLVQVQRPGDGQLPRRGVVAGDLRLQRCRPVHRRHAPTGNRTVIVDQRATGGQWRSLGTFTLPAGDANRVGVSRWSSATGLSSPTPYASPGSDLGRPRLIDSTSRKSGCPGARTPRLPGTPSGSEPCAGCRWIDLR